MKVDDLYWLFSTIAQTLGAIVGVIGMLSVYKLQTLTSSMNELIRQSDRILSRYFGEDAPARTPKLIIERWEEFIEGHEVRNKGDRNAFDRLISALTASLSTRKKVKVRFLIFIYLNLLMIIISILALPYCQYLVQWGILISIIVGAFLLIVTLGSTVKLCASLIES